MPFRPEFREALSLLARAVADMTARGFEPPVLVGGAAVEFYTGGAVTSGDFDLVTPHRSALEDALRPHGFRRLSEPGVLTGSMINERLGFAVQVVSGALMDGRADLEKILVVDVGGAALRIIPVEDLIADRVGQAHSTTPPRPDMLDQAVTLLRLAESVDEPYLDRRIREETAGDADLTTLKQHAP